MQLEDYFNFFAPDDIRLKGSRIGIESVLYEYIHRAQTPEQIVERFPHLSLEQIHATILYYLHNKEAVSKYIADWLEYGRAAREQQKGKNKDLLERIRRLKAERLVLQRDEP